MFMEDVTNREKVDDEEQGSQDRSLWHTCGNVDWVGGERF